MDHERTIRRHTRGAWHRTAAMVAAAGLVMIGSLATPASALETDSAEAEGRVLSGGGDVNLDAIVSLAPAYSADPSAPGVVSNPLALSVVDALGIDLGDGIQLFGPNGVIAVGALGQYAAADGDSADAASGAITSTGAIEVGGQGPQDNAYIDVTELLDTAGLSGITDGLVSELRVELGALSATASSVADDLPVGDYQIADGMLYFTSPVIQELMASLDGALATLTDSVNALAGPTGALGSALPAIADDLVTPLADALGAVSLGLVDVSGLSLTAGLTVDLSAALSAITDEPLTDPSGAVTINFSSGEISVDLARLIADSQGGPYDGTLNNLEANTEILDPALIKAGLDGAVGTILDQIPALLVDAANDTLDSTEMTFSLTGTADVAPPFLPPAPLVDIDVEITGTVASFLGLPGAPAPVLDTSGTVALGVIPIGTLLTPITSTIVETLLPALVTPLADAITGVGILDTVFRPSVDVATTALEPVTGVINQVLSITANVQEDGQFTAPGGYSEGAFTQRALSVSLLPVLGTPLAEVNLASATVRTTAVQAVEVAITAPLDGAVLTVPDSGATLPLAVTGTGEVGADVVVSAPGLPSQSTVVGPDGSWTVTFPDVGVGSYVVTATQTAGTDVSTATVGVTVEVGAIEDVSITTPLDGQVFTVPAGGATDVVVSGTGQIGADVVVTVPGQDDQTVTVGPEGTWTATFAALGTGTYPIEATQAVGAESSSDLVTVEVVDVDPVTVTSPSDGDVLTVPVGGTTDLVVAGTGEAGADVVVSVTGQGDQTVAVDPDGTWTVTFPGLGAGTYEIVASQSVAGQESSADLTVEVVEVVAVAITSPADGTVYSVPSGGTTALVVSGTGDAGAEVVASISGQPDQTATVAPDGTWTVTFPALGVGSYEVTASQLVGDQLSTDDVSVEVVVGDIEQVTITSPEDGDVITVPEGGTTDLVVTGTGEVDGEVVVTIPGQPAQTATVGPDGTWTVTFPGLGDGSYQVTATQTAQGQTNVAVVSVVVDGVVPVTIVEPTDGDVLAIPAGETTDLVASGTGDPGAEVVVSVTGQDDQTATVAPDGTWTVSFPGLGEGTYEVTATQTVGDQTTTESVTVEVDEVDQVVIVAPEDGDVIPVVEGGARDLVVSGTGDAGAEVTVSTEGQDDQTATVAPDGTWTVTFPGLGTGTYEITATQTVGEQTSSSTVTVELAEVVAVTITEPGDGDVITLRPGETEDLVVTGAGQPGADVVVTVEGQEEQTVTVSPDGTWTATFPGLGEGTYEVSATQTVGDQTTTDSVTVTLEVDGDQVGEPFAVVAYPWLVRGEGVVQVVYGTGFVPGESVTGEVRSTPLPLGPVVADADGNVTLSFPVGETFELGTHDVVLTGSISGPLGADQLATTFVVTDGAGGGVVTPPGGSVVVPPPSSVGGGVKPGTSRPSGSLARTGADDLAVGLAAGAVLLLLGGTAVAVRRRGTLG